jgi:hypothetical protein
VTNYVSDKEWCKVELLKDMRKHLTDGGYPEEEFFRLARDTKFGRNRPSWAARSPGRRAIVISEAITGLIRDCRIEPVPGTTQASGRRLFQDANPLDAIVAAL